MESLKLGPRDSSPPPRGRMPRRPDRKGRVGVVVVVGGVVDGVVYGHVVGADVRDFLLGVCHGLYGPLCGGDRG